MILPDDEGRVCYFIARETPASRVLVAQLAKYRKKLSEDLKRFEERNPGKVEEFKGRIRQRFPGVPLKPLE